jgi:hypothetical protein
MFLGRTFRFSYLGLFSWKKAKEREIENRTNTIRIIFFMRRTGLVCN